MELENRYHVIKVSDADKYLSAAEYCTLSMLLEKVSEARKADDKPELNGIFIEHDWPEYHETRQSLIDRIKGDAIRDEIIAELPELFANAARKDAPPIGSLLAYIEAMHLPFGRYDEVLDAGRMYLASNIEKYPWDITDFLKAPL